MTDIIDFTAYGEQIHYDAAGNAMVNQGGQWVYVPQYNRTVHQQQASAPQPAQVYQPQTAPVYQQAPSTAGTMLDFFTGSQSTGTAVVPAYVSGESSMDGQDSTLVDTIRINKRGEMVIRLGGIDMPPQRYLDVVILGCGPRGGGNSNVYRTFYQQDYDENAVEHAPPACFSYDNITPAATAPTPQCATCKGCPWDVKGSGPNGTRRCAKSKYLMVALVGDTTKAYRMKLSSKAIYSSDIARQEYGLHAYATLLKSKQANWEGMITRVSCPGGFSEGIRFLPINFLDEQTYKQIQELKMKLDLDLYINLDNNQATVMMNGAPVGQIPVNTVGQVAQNVQQAVQAVVQQAVAQPTHATVAPASAPAPAPALAPAPAPAPQPVSFKDQLRAHPAFSTLPADVQNYVLHPQVADNDAHTYLASYYPHVLAPATPTPATTAPAVNMVNSTGGGVATGAPAAQQVITQPAVQSVQPTQTVASTAQAVKPMMPAQPAEPTAPTTAAAPVVQQPAASAPSIVTPQPAQADGTLNGESVNDILKRI